MKHSRNLRNINLLEKIKKDRKIKILRSHRGGEYFPNEFDSYCEEQGLIHQKSAPYTPQ